MIRTICFGAVVVLGAVGGALLTAVTVPPDRDRMLLSIPSKEARAAIVGASVVTSGGLLRTLGASSATRAVVAGAVLRFHAMALAVPVSCALLVLGAIAGMLRRERVRAGVGYSSPLRAFVAKHVAVGALAMAMAIALAPVQVGPWAFYAAAATAAAGLGAWIANLPVRL